VSRPFISDHHARVFTLGEMLTELIYIMEGNKVLLRCQPDYVLRFSEFEGLTAASMVANRQRLVSMAKAWRNHPQRVTVKTVSQAQLYARNSVRRRKKAS